MPRVAKFQLLTFPTPKPRTGGEDPIGEAVEYLRCHAPGAYDTLGEVILDSLDNVLARHTSAHAAGDWAYPDPPAAIDVDALRRRHGAIVRTNRGRS